MLKEQIDKKWLCSELGMTPELYDDTDDVFRWWLHKMERQDNWGYFYIKLIRNITNVKFFERALPKEEINKLYKETK